MLRVLNAASVLAFCHCADVVPSVSQSAASESQVPEVIYAINAGGDTHTDIHGIRYERDPLFGKSDCGTASEFGRTLLIARSHLNDQILYQTERYHTSTFGYDIPVSQDGNYVMILKFCEVYFDAPGQKIFDVVLNHEHIVVPNLDIFARVGRGVALDVVVPFRIKSNMLFVIGQQSTHTGKIRVDFAKGESDNPKINAVVVARGGPDSVHELIGPMPMPVPVAVQTTIEGETVKPVFTPLEETTDKTYAAPPPADPAYGLEELISLLPIIGAIGAFVPVLFCWFRI